MRSWAALVMVGVAMAAHADPIGRARLLDQTREGEPAERAEAAERIARRISTNNVETIDLALAAVISNDPKVRAPLFDALIAAKLIERAGAAQIPTASVLEKRIRQLLPKDRPASLPLARDCAVVTATARSAQIVCRTSNCGRACIHEMRSFRITTGVRWKVEEIQNTRTEDGACGHCELVE